MRRSRLLALAVLAALLCGLAHDRPCDDDAAGTPRAPTAVSPACPASDQHQDPESPDHGCACLCHVPVLHPGDVPQPGPAVVVVPPGVRLRAALRPGSVDAPFRPPRA